jgi:hypothetical protein
MVLNSLSFINPSIMPAENVKNYTLHTKKNYAKLYLIMCWKETRLAGEKLRKTTQFLLNLGVKSR